MNNQEIEKIFEEVKSQYDYWLNPREDNELWAQFGKRIYAMTIKRGGDNMEEKINGIIIRLNKEQLNNFQVCRVKISQIVASSINPDVSAKLDEILDEVEESMKTSLNL